jgi:DNA ligase-1
VPVYAALTKTFSLIEATTKRLENALLTSFFLLVIQRSKKDDSNTLLQSAYLCINRSPDYVGVELGIGESLLIKAISESTGRSLATVKADFKKEGDRGNGAVSLLSLTLTTSLLHSQNSKNSQKTLFKPKPLTAPFVFSNLREIVLSSGHSVCSSYRYRFSKT